LTQEWKRGIIVGEFSIMKRGIYLNLKYHRWTNYRDRSRYIESWEIRQRFTHLLPWFLIACKAKKCIVGDQMNNYDYSIFEKPIFLTLEDEVRSGIRFYLISCRVKFINFWRQPLPPYFVPPVFQDR